MYVSEFRSRYLGLKSTPQSGSGPDVISIIEKPAMQVLVTAGRPSEAALRATIPSRAVQRPNERR